MPAQRWREENVAGRCSNGRAKYIIRRPEKGRTEEGTTGCSEKGRGYIHFFFKIERISQLPLSKHMELQEGSVAIIRPYHNDSRFVEKRYKRSVSQRKAAMELEKDIHTEVWKLLVGSRLRVPAILPACPEYVMERVDVSKPLWEPDVWDKLSPQTQTFHIETLAHSLNVLASYSYHMRDVEVYLQSDGSLMMLDFSQAYKMIGHSERTLETAAMVPPSVVKRLEETWNEKPVR